MVEETSIQSTNTFQAETLIAAAAPFCSFERHPSALHHTVMAGEQIFG